MPGAGKQPPEVQQRIKELLEAGFDPTTIHRKLKVGRSSIYRMKRCLQQHGQAYMPVDMNKKNGRPKVLSAEQELEVRNWLRDPKNRGRYLDDLVWLIHDRFQIVCSTTTMSKLKRKWLRVIECEESGEPLDELTRSQVAETHPDLPILQQVLPGAPMVPMMSARPGTMTAVADGAEGVGAGEHGLVDGEVGMDDQQQVQMLSEHDFHNEDGYTQPPPHSRAHHPDSYPHPPLLPLQQPDQEALMDPQLQHMPPPPPSLPHQHEPQIDPRFEQLQSQALDAQLQQRLQCEMAGQTAAEVSQA